MIQSQCGIFKNQRHMFNILFGSNEKRFHIYILHSIQRRVNSLSYAPYPISYGQYHIYMDIIIYEVWFRWGLIEHGKSPFKWLYIGTERGNVHLVNYENFLLNDYVINWNKGKSIILFRVPRPGQNEARTDRGHRGIQPNRDSKNETRI